MLKFAIVLLSCTVFTAAKPSNGDTPAGRIIGGEPRDIQSIPYQLSLWNGTLHLGGAALISPAWALTAAHCIVTNDDTYRHLWIRANSSDCTTGGKIIEIIEYIKHPYYEISNPNLDYDIGLLKLRESDTIGLKYARFPACNALTWKADDAIVVSGWGVNNIQDEKKKYILQSVRLSIVDFDGCVNQFKKDFDVTDRQICGGFKEGGKDACQGDSGGPVTHKGDLIAIVSAGIKCAVANTPGLYANIFESTILEWLMETTKIEKFCRTPSVTPAPKSGGNKLLKLAADINNIKDEAVKLKNKAKNFLSSKFSLGVKSGKKNNQSHSGDENNEES